ncbi:hypothetical protein LTR84_000266 [Exophiala bonariae]|uniref:Major facilitator superfamily (MFS) profile domain-containing protein n=1 Tax=Exophiala bonariae TaxID=1690606 RepID=A0AAV9NTS9_9EURO|nr:hypothetical protein LTR84_000266 [Exophiala bonariae]
MSSSSSTKLGSHYVERPGAKSEADLIEPLMQGDPNEAASKSDTSREHSANEGFIQQDAKFTSQSPPRSPSPDNQQELSVIEDVEIEAKREAPVTWMSLPKKDQLAVLTIARLSEPLAERSFSAYLFYQLRSFDPSLSDKTISGQGGMLTAAFAAAQFVTAVWWGRAADSPRVGRKRVILIGLVGTTISCVGVGFSTSFTQALFFRICAGCLNGNIGVMRTMISEIIKEKKFQSRAFLLLPMCFNVGVVIGPILGGFLADPIASFPNVFGPGSAIGGKDGVEWMTSFPYALPNLVSAFFILVGALCVIFGLDETHQAIRGRPDYGRKLGRWMWRHIFRRDRGGGYGYHHLQNQDDLQDASPLLNQSEEPHHPPPTSMQMSTMAPAASDTFKTRPPFRQILTKNVILTLLCHHLMAMHVSAFNAVIFLYLPAPRSDNKNAHLPFLFSGGLGLSSKNVGLATAIIGIIGFPLQLLIYPRMQSKLGTLPSYKMFLPFSILAYLSAPYLSLLPNQPLLIWPILTVVLSLQTVSRTFSLPGQTLLANNCTPHPGVLGLIHGLAQSASSGARTIGPTVGGWGLGLGLAGNCVGAIWWAMACVAAANWCLLWVIYEGDAGQSVVSRH